MNTEKILAICLSPDQGGLELYFIKLIKYYKMLGRNIHVGCLKNSYINQVIEDNKIECHRKGLFQFIKNFRLLQKYILTKNIEFLHVSWAKDIFLAVLLKIFTPRNIKIIFYRQMKLSRPKKDFYHKFIYENIDLFLVITDKLKSEAIKYLPISSKKIKKLTYGIQKPNSSTIINKGKFFEKYGLNENIFTIGVFSRIEEQKGQHLIIEAMKLESNDIQLCVIGHAMNEQYKKRLINDAANYDLKNNLKFIDFVESPMSYMPCFDLIILPTYEETFGLIVAEAMIMKVPVIGSNAGGVPEIITHGKNGLLFETKNASDLSIKINMILKDRDFRNTLVLNGFDYANNEYAYDAHFDKLENMIDTI
jgi:glycosyltransferase involved in cell wall biosynthesis